MTVDELIAKLTELSNAGNGDWVVVDSHDLGLGVDDVKEGWRSKYNPSAASWRVTDYDPNWYDPDEDARSKVVERVVILS